MTRRRPLSRPNRHSAWPPRLPLSSFNPFPSCAPLGGFCCPWGLLVAVEQTHLDAEAGGSGHPEEFACCTAAPCLCMILFRSLCCQFLALPHPHPPLRTFRSCSFQKNYLKRTFAASKSAFSIMSYESITAGCLFAGRACSTHPPSPPVPPRLRPCTLLTLPPPHFLQPCGLCMGGSLCCQFLALPHPHPPLRSFGGCSFQKNYLKRIFTASKSAFSMMS